MPVQLGNARISRKRELKFLAITKKREDGTPVPPTNIFNYDETNLSDDPGTKKSIFRRGVKYPETVKDSTNTSTSIMFSVVLQQSKRCRHMLYTRLSTCGLLGWSAALQIPDTIEARAVGLMHSVLQTGFSPCLFPL